jgi:hypothetical protein
MAQAAADAGAQAGLLSFYSGTYTTGTFSTPHTCTTSDSLTPCQYATNNGFINAANPGDVVTVTYGNDTSASVPPGVTLPPTATYPVSWMRVTITRSVPTTLMRLLRTNSASIGVTATAAVATASPACITALDTSGTGIKLGGSADVELGTCGIQDNSDMDVNGGKVKVRAGSVLVNGSFPTGQGDIQPTPTHGPRVNDPYAYLQPPTPTTPCDAAHTNRKITGGTVTLDPGTYCGGFNISGGTVTFNPGTYVLLGGGFGVNGNAALTGNGVTFYNTFDGSHSYGVVNMNGTGAETLSAPVSGSLQGILFFESRNAPTSQTELINGNAGQTFTGVLYFPNNEVDYQGSDTTTQNLAIVAKYAQFTGNANLTVNASPASGGPVVFKVALVQ